jgi:hypothetical protein
MHRASYFQVFNNPYTLQNNTTEEIDRYLAIFNEQLKNKALRNRRHQKTKKKLFVKSRLAIIYKSIFDEEYRDWFIKRIADKKWYTEKLIQLGFKKT